MTPSVSSTDSIPAGFGSQKLWNLFCGTGTPDWGACCGAGTPHSQDIPPDFLSTIHGCGTSLFHFPALPSSLDGCGFFNSIVVKLPFNSISDGSE